MTKAKKRARTVQNRFDGEALGLVLFALGIFLIITLVLPAQGAGFMSQAHAALMTWLSWGSYTLPMIPLCYGVLIFLNKELRNLTRRLLGAGVVVLSLLLLQELFAPNTAGQLAALALGPLRAVSYAAALLPIITLTLGLELVLRLPAFSMLKSFFRTLSAGVGLLLGWGQAAVEARQEGKETAHQRQQVRQHLSAHSRDLDTLGKLYPESRELQHWKDETKGAGKQVRALDEHGLKDMEAELKHWRDVSSSFVLGAGRDLRAAVDREAPEAGSHIEMLAQEVRAGRHELSLELPSTLASGALERLRRSLVMDLYRLSAKAGGLERERRRAAKALEKPDTSLLSRERPAHAQRLQGWRELAEAYAAWSARSAPYAGWPDLARAYDAGPTRLAETLEQALLTDPDTVLSEKTLWQEKLEQTQPEVAGAPLLDFDFGSHESGAHEYGGAVSAEVGSALTYQPPLIDLYLNAEPPTQSAGQPPTERMVISAQPVAVGAGATQGQTPPLPQPSGRKLGADTLPWEESGEVLPPARSRPKQGALELAIPGVDLLDPIPPEVHNTLQLDISAQATGRADQRDAAAVRTAGQGRGLRARPHRHPLRDRTRSRREDQPHCQPQQRSGAGTGGGRGAHRSSVPGKSVIGLEVPNAEREPVTFHQGGRRAHFPQHPRQAADHSGQEHRR